MTWMVWMGLCRRGGANADNAGWERFVVWKGFGSVEWCDRPCDFESVGLKRGWTVEGLHGHFLVADFDAHRVGCFVVARIFQEAGWSECWCTRTIHEERTCGRTVMPSSHHASEMEWPIKSCWRGGQMDCGRAGWTDDFHFSPFA